MVSGLADNNQYSFNQGHQTLLPGRPNACVQAEIACTTHVQHIFKNASFIILYISELFKV